MKSKWLIVVGLLVFAGLALWFDLPSFLNLERAKSLQNTLGVYRESSPVLLSFAYMAAYVVVAGFSIPGATVLTLLGGALFGLWWGGILVAIGATLGASVAFLMARFILGDAIAGRYQDKLEKFNSGVSQNAMSYILFLRLVPVFPFFVINVVLGLTRMKFWVFFAGSFVGMLPGILVYTNAGTQLATIQSLGDIVTPGVLGAFVLLGGFALIPVFYQIWVKGARRGH